jgi:hypothetical protein
MMQAIGPLRGTAARRATLGVLLLLLPWVLVATTSPSTAAAAEPPKAVTPAATGLLEIVTVPNLPGARFMVDGRAHRADRQGVIRLRVDSGHKHKISVIDKKIAESDRTLEFVRWYYGNHDEDHLDALSGLTVRRNLRIKAGYRATYKLQYSFVDRARNPVDRTRVSRVEFRGDHGQTVSGNGSGRLTVVGIRPVVAGGTIIAKTVSYTVQRVDVDGSNVVQVNVQRFEPSRKTTVLIPLQLHTLHLSTRDFLFGNPVGTAVWLKYPDGHRFKVLLDADGKATVERLARGNYTVQVDAPGLSFERSLVLSRTQYVDLQHVSRPDIAVAASALAAFLFLLYLVRVRGRPVVLRSARFGPSGVWTTTQLIPPTMATEQLSTHEMADTEAAKPAAVDEEIPAQRISQVTVARQQLATQGMADPGVADRGDVDAEKFDGEKELADEKLDGTVDYRTRVVEAQLPDHVRKAAFREVGKLERTSAQSAESREIRIWLDTILALPWTANSNTTDSIDIQAEREADSAAANSENLDTEKVDPPSADTKIVDGERVDPAAAEIETSDTAPAGPQDAQSPRENRRLGSLVVGATALAVLLVGALLFGVTRDGGVTAQSVPSVPAAKGSKPTSVPSDRSTDKGGQESTIQLEDLPEPARPFQTVPIQGTYRGGANTLLRVQRWEAGKWLTFPIPNKTDRSGQFTAYVELGQPGRYQLRLLDPTSGVTSRPVVLVIKG